MSPGMDHATLVREIRRRLGLTQEKFAARLGVTFPTVNRWENGKARPSPLAAQKIKDILMDMGENAEDLRRAFGCTRDNQENTCRTSK